MIATQKMNKGLCRHLKVKDASKITVIRNLLFSMQIGIYLSSQRAPNNLAIPLIVKETGKTKF